MNATAYHSIRALLDRKRVPYVTFEHRPCRTSEESRAARTEAGYPNAIGAKSLLMKLYIGSEEQFATLVLPGTHTLNKQRLKQSIPGLRRMRFVTAEEMTDLAGVVSGCMPPFATPIFPNIPILILATAITACKEVGFNAAYLERSVVMQAKDYVSVVTPTYVIDCSDPKAE